MALLQRVGHLISNDFGALLPGTGIALDRAALLRLRLYVCLFIFAVRIFLPVLTGPDRKRLSPANPAPAIQPEIRRGEDRAAPALDVQDI